MKSLIKLEPEHYLDLIKGNKPFAFSRFGDGEILCMFHCPTITENCDGSAFLDELIEPMKQIFRNKYNYYHCLLDCSADPVLKKEVDEFHAFIEEVCPDMDFYYGEVWQRLSFDDRIGELVRAISPYKPVFVGGEHIANVSYMHGMEYNNVIEIPSVDAFLSFNDIFTAIMQLHEQGRRMFCFSAGYSTKPLIDTLWPHIGHNTFLIDMGSVFDPYCGKLSRDNMKWNGYKKFQPFTDYKLK